MDRSSGEGSVPAADAASDFFLASDSLSSLLTGLRLRCDAECLVDGDLERWSKRDDRLGSGSFWSKRERLEVRFSSSAILRPMRSGWDKSG